MRTARLFAVGALLNLGFGAGIYDKLPSNPHLVFRAETVPNLALGVGVGVLTAVVSGLSPAWKASRAEPVEALRG